MLFPLDEMANIDCDVYIKWKEILEIDFKKGGSFLAEPDLEAK